MGELNQKVWYSTNWMGPISLDWYKERGLVKKQKTQVDTATIYQVTEHYSAGRIDVRGGSLGPYGDELSLPPMKQESWSRFSDWLDTFETDEMWSLDQLVEQYEKENPKIEWWVNKKEDKDE